MHYGVFGLGNKQYEHFNAVGKRMMKNMDVLGGSAVCARGDGDDDDNIGACCAGAAVGGAAGWLRVCVVWWRQEQGQQEQQQSAKHCLSCCRCCCCLLFLLRTDEDFEKWCGQLFEALEAQPELLGAAGGSGDASLATYRVAVVEGE